ncbi:MAG TPA: type IX secretion system membrane protein PorP/SprF [Bacteroidia bacterium]|nr:type IX secretion system membrane protein PorP/SprF [Bacteroidia bacterium]
MIKQRLILLYIVISIAAQAQQLPLKSQYLQNDFMLNPAVAGSKEYIPITLSHRSQWVNFEGAPMTQMLSVHGKLCGKNGLGLLISNTQAGPTRVMSAQLAYAYHIQLADSVNLSFGLAPTFIQYALDKNKIVLEQQADNTLQRISGNSWVMDANFGMYLYGKKYFAGLAFPQLLENKIGMGDKNIQERVQRYCLLHAGYDFTLNAKFDLSPSFLFKSNKSFASPAQTDLNLKLMYKKFIWAGLSYRMDLAQNSDNAAIAFLGFAKANFSFGYSYDYSFSSIGKNSVGSHELFITYRFYRKIKSKEATPQYNTTPQNAE